MTLASLRAPSIVARGFGANTQDAIKAFYSLSRQALLDAISEVWPEANAQFAAYYDPASVCVLYTLTKIVRGTRSSVSRSAPMAPAPDACSAVLGLTSPSIILCTNTCMIEEFDDLVIKSLTDDMPSFFPLC